jgi:predicted transglutaminase-like cysteine proteinase
MSATFDRLRHSTRQGLSAITMAVFAVVLATALLAAPGLGPAAHAAAKPGTPLVLESYPETGEAPAGTAPADAQAAPEEAGAPISADSGSNPMASITEETDPGSAPSTPTGGEAASAESQAAPIRLFGTVEFRSPIKNLPKWERVRDSEIKRPTFISGGVDLDVKNASVEQRWNALRDKFKDAPIADQVREVNKFFNQWPYKTDMEVYGVEDYWATPREFIQKSGDCEDYAIAKYYALRELGVPADRLRVAAVKDTIRNLGHAILIVYMNDDAYILDNLTNLVLSHKKLTHYAPQYTVNEEFLWRHVVPKAQPPPAKKK